jgi:hypothetical protein
MPSSIEGIMKRSKFIVAILILSAFSILFWNNSVPNTAHSSLELDSMPESYLKNRAMVEAKVEWMENEEETGFIRLKGIVVSKEDFSGVKVTWEVPQRTKIISGEPETTIDLKAGQPQEFEVVIAPKKEGKNAKVHFRAITTHLPLGENYGATAGYNTKKQKEIDEKTKENFAKAKAMIKAGKFKTLRF